MSCRYFISCGRPGGFHPTRALPSSLSLSLRFSFLLIYFHLIEPITVYFFQSDHFSVPASQCSVRFPNPTFHTLWPATQTANTLQLQLEFRLRLLCIILCLSTKFTISVAGAHSTIFNHFLYSLLVFIESFS